MMPKSSPEQGIFKKRPDLDIGLKDALTIAGAVELIGGISLFQKGKGPDANRSRLQCS